MNWYALSYRELKNGDLEIKTQGKIGKAAIMEVFGEDDALDSDTAMFQVFEYLTANGLNWISPENIGALTSSPILSDTPDGDIREDSKVWWFPNYQVESPLRTLVEKGRVIFKKA
jgi:hypothetical protein